MASKFEHSTGSCVIIEVKGSGYAYTVAVDGFDLTKTLASSADA